MLKIKSHKRLEGYLPQRFQPTTFVFIECTLKSIPSDTIKKFSDDVLLLLASEKKNKDFSLLNMLSSDVLLSQEDILKKIILLTQATLEVCGFPKFEFFTKLLSNEKEKYIFRISTEELEGRSLSVVKILDNLISIVNSLILNDADYDAKLKFYLNLFKYLKKNAPQGINTLKFIVAAKTLDIPCRKVVNNVFQFGWGSNSRWFDSSFSDLTPQISTKIARNKIACTQILRDAGFPVPRNFQVTSANQAVVFANKLGYPVVIKPANLDGGVGVFSKLTDDNSVLKAYDKVSKISNYIMIEEYIFGKDYRIQVCNNQVYAAVERQGPRVFGDGRHSIRELIDIFNTDRSVNNMKSDTQLPLIVFNDDLKDYLFTQSLTLDDIPDLGNVTELRAANNVSGGGSFYSIFDKVHPDNIELARRISQFMRLDILGIDFLISDISISWKDVKCGICEINTQPQISGDKHKYVLQKTLTSNGRIPTLLFLGKFNGSSIHDKALQCLIPKGLNVGFANSDSAWINHEKILKGISGVSGAGTPLLLNPSVDFLLLELDLSAQVLPILPVDKVDAIMISHNIPELIQDPKKVIWLKKILSFSKHIISFSGHAELLSRNLKIPSQFVNDRYPGDIESIFNQLIQKR